MDVSDKEYILIIKDKYIQTEETNKQTNNNLQQNGCFRLRFTLDIFVLIQDKHKHKQVDIKLQQNGCFRLKFIYSCHLCPRPRQTQTNK